MTRHMFRSVLTAIVVAALGWSAVRESPDAAFAQGAGAARSATTPRTADGKPDLSGFWAGGGGVADKPDASGNLTVLTRARPCAPGQAECLPGVNFERDSGIRQRMVVNIPIYKPEFWERVQYLDTHGNAEDPGFGCYPLGVPRMGPPSKVVQTPNELIFLYQAKNTFRVIRFGPHDPINSVDQTWMGDSVARWDGDTLVVDVVGLTGETWLAWPGWFHSNNMRVIERLRREGDTLTWQATVEDPDVLLQPWVMDPRTLRLNPDPKAFPLEDLPCEERDLGHMQTRERG